MSLPVIIGCEEFPKSEQGKLLIEDICAFINQQYGYSGKQIVEAFELASSYSLYMDGKRVDPSTFGKHLSRASVGKVLTAYREQQRREKVTSPYLALPEAQTKTITPLEAYELCHKWFKQEGELINAPANMAYEYLLSQGKVSKVEQVKTNRFVDNNEGLKHREVEKYFKNLRN